MPRTLKIFSDFACPFCFLAKAMISYLGADLSPSVIWIPMELHPEIPKEGALLKKFAPDINVTAFQKEMNIKGAPYGVYFSNFSRVYNSGRAIRAAEFARDAGQFESFHTAVFKKLFTEGQNIGAPFVLRDLAREQGLDPEAMDRAIDEGAFESRLRTAAIAAAEYRVMMAPTFILPGASSPVAGLPAKEKLLAMLQEAATV